MQGPDSLIWARLRQERNGRPQLCRTTYHLQSGQGPLQRGHLPRVWQRSNQRDLHPQCGFPILVILDFFNCLSVQRESRTNWQSTQNTRISQGQGVPCWQSSDQWCKGCISPKSMQPAKVQSNGGLNCSNGKACLSEWLL